MDWSGFNIIILNPLSLGYTHSVCICVVIRVTTSLRLHRHCRDWLAAEIACRVILRRKLKKKKFDICPSNDEFAFMSSLQGWLAAELVCEVACGDLAK